MKVTALMPMKAVSERVPNKNMRSFHGKPLCTVMLDKLLASRYIDKVIVNTDSKIIRNYLETHYNRVLIVDRPQSLVGHDVSMNKIIDHDLGLYESDVFLQTHSTNPLLRTETIDTALETFVSHKNDYDSLFSVTRFQTRFYDNQGFPINHDPSLLIKTQDLPVMYEENSCIYVFTKESFSSCSRRIGEKPYLFEIDAFEAIDIDVEREFALAEKLYTIAP